MEQDADFVLFIYRKDKERLDATEEEQRMTEIIIANHLNGPVGSVKLMYDAELVCFKNLDTHHAEELQS